MKLTARCREAIAQFFESQAKAQAMNIDPMEANMAAIKTLEKMQETPRFMDKVSEFYTNALISGVATPIVNAYSIMRMFADVPIKFIEGGINDTLRVAGMNVDAMKPGLSEAAGFAKGAISPWTSMKALQEIVDFGKRGLLEGHPLDAPTDYANKAIGMGRILSDGTVKESGAIEKGFGAVVRTPTRVAVGIDELMKAYYRRVKVYELMNKVQSRYTDEMLAKKGTSREKLMEVLQDAIDNPGKNSKWQHQLMTADPDMYEEVVNFAKKQTFQEDPPEWVKSFMKMKERHPAWSLVAPFIRTPHNITSQGLENVPALGILPKLLKKNEGGRGKHFSADVFKDSEVMAKQMFGLASTFAIYQAFENEIMTAGYPRDAAKRQELIDKEIPEYGLKVGDTWIDWSRIEPFATVAIGIGTYRQTMKDFEEEYKKNGVTPTMKQKLGDAGLSVADAMSKALIQRQFLFGISAVLDALKAPKDEGGKFLNQAVGNVAMPAFAAGIARSMDPVQRKIDGPIDAIKNRTPFLRETLPVEYKTFGGPRENPQHGAAAFFPAIENIGDNPTELQQFTKEIGFRKGPVGKSIQGIKLTPEEYETYSRIANEEVTKSLEARMPALQRNTAMTNERKRYLMEKWTDDARERAGKIFLRELAKDRPSIYKEIADQKRRDKGLL